MVRATDGAPRAEQCIVYVRVSDAKQSGASSQLTNARHLARAHGLDVLAEVEDDGRSGDDLGRPGLADVLARLEKAHAQGRPVGWVIVDQTDRLSRADSLDTAEVYARMRRLGVRKVATPSRVYDLHSPMDRTLLGIESDHKNHPYLKDLGRRVLNGMLDSARNGFWTGQKPPLGYRVAYTPGEHGGRRRRSGRLEVDPDTGPVVRELFERYRDGESTRDLARWLKARTGRGWTRQGVQRILQRETYTGTRVFGNRPTGKHARLVDGVAAVRGEDDDGEAGAVRLAVAPALVDLALFAQVRKRIEGGRSRGRRKGVPTHPLAGLARCAECGAPMHCSKTGGYPYMVCPRWKEDGQEGCKTGAYVRSDLVLARVLETLAEQLLEGDAVARLIELAGKAEGEARAAWEANVAAAERSLGACDGKLATARRRLAEAPEDLLDDYQRLVRDLKADRAELEAELARLRAELPAVEEGDAELLRRWLETCRSACAGLPEGTDGNAVMRELVEEVRVFPPPKPRRGRKVGRVEAVLPEWLSSALATSASNGRQHARSRIVLVSDPAGVESGGGSR